MLSKKKMVKVLLIVYTLKILVQIISYLKLSLELGRKTYLTTLTFILTVTSCKRKTMVMVTYYTPSVSNNCSEKNRNVLFDTLISFLFILVFVHVFFHSNFEDAKNYFHFANLAFEGRKEKHIPRIVLMYQTYII